MASYDRMDWHYDGDYPKHLPTENGGTHIGMFLAWIINNDLHGDMHRQESKESIHKVLTRQWTGRDFLIQECDEKFWEGCLNKDGNEFTKSIMTPHETMELAIFLRITRDCLARPLTQFMKWTTLGIISISWNRLLTRDIRTGKQRNENCRQHSVYCMAWRVVDQSLSL